jgi:hypothetical protein
MVEGYYIRIFIFLGRNISQNVVFATPDPTTAKLCAFERTPTNECNGYSELFDVYKHINLSTVEWDGNLCWGGTITAI